MKRSKRLETIISMVPACSCAADVGTDHGFVPIDLVRTKKAGRAIAMDVKKGPLERARAHIAEAGLENQIETRMSDGLAALEPGEADMIVISGMGGELMLRILCDGLSVCRAARRLILSPQSELSRFRHGLEKLGFAIIDEVMIKEDGKYYTVMAAEPGSMDCPAECFYRYGPVLIRSGSPVLRQFLQREKEQYRQIEAQLESQDGEGAKRRLMQIREELKQVKEAYNEMQRSSEQAGAVSSG